MDQPKQIVSVCFGCLNKNTTYQVAYKQQKCVFHCSGGWEVQGQSASSFGVQWEPSSWFIEAECPL